MALRWRTGDQDYDAMLVLDKAPDGQQITGQWSGTHPRTPTNLTLSGGAATRHGIVLHGDDGDRPWEITIGRTTHNITISVYDGAGCRPELPVMHATYTDRAGHCPWHPHHQHFIPVLTQQRDQATALAEDATGRGWDSETERHLKLINRINDLITAADARGQAM
jgi:uncharacterized protein YndB with AHSA1/START domain